MFTVQFTHKSWLKKSADAQALNLRDSEKREVLVGEEFDVLAMRQINSKVAIMTFSRNYLTEDGSQSFNTWYVYVPHTDLKIKRNNIDTAIKEAIKLGASKSGSKILAIENCTYTIEDGEYVFKPVPDNFYHDKFNDLLIVTTPTDSIAGIYECTVAPGVHYTKNRMNPGGAARLLIDHHYKDQWVKGLHWGKYGLVQSGYIRLRRDANGDGIIQADEPNTNEQWTGINIHRAYGYKIGKNSAGCLAIPLENGSWWSFYNLVTKQYPPANGKYSVTTLSAKRIFS